MALEKLEDRTLLATFTVDTTADTVDVNPGDGLAEDADGNTSLRAAIQEANALANGMAGPDEIHFALPNAGPHTITPATPLPTITEAVVIDGYTQPGSAEATTTTPAVIQIELNGSNVGGSTALNITAGGSTVRGLAINRFHTAIGLTTAGGNVIEGNHIGTDVTGLISLPNRSRGIAVSSGDNLIGTDGDGVDDAGERNVIAGQAPVGVGVGIAIFGAGATNNVVAGNYIGTDATGTAALGMSPLLQSGVTISGGARNNLIGTDGDGMADAAERNIISGHTGGGTATFSGGGGIAIFGAGTDNNAVAGNFIGTDVTGTVSIGNLNHGVTIAFGATSNLIGTDGDGVADVAERNVIAGNAINVQVAGIVRDNVVAGNYIGTDVTGMLVLGNNQFGVFIHTDADTTRVGTNGDGIGDTAEANLIAGNSTAGVFIRGGADSTGNVVAGNLIGTDVTGSVALANAVGVLIEAASNQIGGPTDAEANVIAFNTGAGVAVVGDASIGNRIRGNSLYSNGGLGIDLGNNGVTANDEDDADAGPNNLQNFPVLTAVQTGSNTRVAGRLNSTPNTTFTIDLYSDPEGDPSGSGEGKEHIASFEVTTSMNGDVAFDMILPVATDSGGVVSATATDPAGNTSEFSATTAATAGPEGIFVDVNNSGLVDAGDIDVTAEASDGAFDTDVSEGSYAARDGVGLIINQAVTAEEIDFRADGPVTVNAAPTTTVDDLAVTSDFSDVFFLNATLISADDVEISAGGDIHLDDETVDAQDGVKVSAGANVLASNVGITAGDDVEIEALTGDINIPGANFEVTVDTGDDIKLEARAGDINAQEAVFIAAGDIEFTAGRALNIQSLTAGFYIVFVAGGDVVLRALGGNIEADDAFVAEAGGDVLVSARDRINAAGFEIHAARNIVFHAETGDINMPDSSNFDTILDAGNDIVLATEAGALNAEGATFIADNDIELDAGGTLNVNRALIDAAGIVALEADEGDVEAEAAVILAGNSVDVEAGGSINAAGIVILATADVKLEAETGDVAIADAATVVESVNGDIKLEADGGTVDAQNGTFTAGDDLEMSAGMGLLVSNAIISAVKDIELESTSGDVDAAGARIAAGNDIEIGAFANLLVAGSEIVAGEDVELAAGIDVDVQRASLTAGEDIVLSAGEEVLLQDATLIAGGRIVIDGTEVGMPVI